VALEYWMRRGGWHGAGSDETAAARAAAGGGGWCVHCGHAGHEMRLFVRASGEHRDGRSGAGSGSRTAVREAGGGYAAPAGAACSGRYRAFSRCNACGLVVELRQGTALAAVEAALDAATACPAPS
jgi:hypothetical protein